MQFPALPVILPLLVATLLAAVGSILPRRFVDLIAITTSAAVCGICCFLIKVSATRTIVYWFGNWTPTPHGHFPIGICFMIDPIGAGLAAMVAMLVLAAFIFSWAYFQSIKALYHALMLVFLAAMCGLCLTGDLFNLFVWFELMTASAVGLCGYMPEEKTPLLGALNFAVSNTVGAFLSLTGVALLYARTGSLNMCEVGRSLISHNPGSHFLLITFLLVISGFLVKAAAFPFHFWLADAHAVAPTPVCILLSGVMVELGVYAVARLYWVIFQPPLGDHARGIQVIFIAIGCLGALTGGIFCFGQRHLKRLLAFSTISHVGLMFLGLGLMTTTALTGVAIYVIGHGMIKGALFVCAGVFLNRFGSVDEFDLRGRGRKVAPLAILMLLGAWGLAGLPPFGTFYGQLLIDHAAQRNGLEWLSIIIILAEALTAAAVLRATGRIFLGWGKVREATSRGSAHIKLMPETNTKSTSPRTPVSMWIPALLLLVVGMGLFTPIRVRAILHSRINAFQDGLSYQSAVLDGHSATSIAGPFTMNAAPSWQQLITLVATGLLALIALFPASIGRQANKSLGYLIARRMKQLRKLQSGRLGDYVAWLAFGVAAYGLTLLFFRKAG